MTNPNPPLPQRRRGNPSQNPYVFQEQPHRRGDFLSDVNWEDFENDDITVSESEETTSPPIGQTSTLQRPRIYGLGEGETVQPPASIKEIDSETIEYTDREEESVNINDLLRIMLQEGGSDLHLTAGVPPKVRIDGDIQDLPGNFSPLTGKKIDEIITAIMTEQQRNVFDKSKELDFAYELPGESRFRVNVLKQRTNVGVVMRTIPNEILTLDRLKMPPVLKDFSKYPRGLVLVAGPTGSGKSTTLAAIIDEAKRTRRDHIMTIEDPIEFVHEHGNSIVNQREVGTDTDSFADALRHVLRQDPDIILIGEMRDPETAAIALTAAETGHLVFATLHTQSAADTVNRIIDMFPDGQKDQIQAQLAASLKAIVCQNLLKKSDGKGRVAATEILISNHAVKNSIRKGKTEMIKSTMITSSGEGMQTMDACLVDLMKKGEITIEDGLQKAQDYDSVTRELGGEEGIARIKREVEYKKYSDSSLGGRR